MNPVPSPTPDEQAAEEPKYGVENGWLFEYVNEHTCGTGRDGYYGAHEPGCGTIPVGRIDDILADSAALVVVREQLAAAEEKARRNRGGRIQATSERNEARAQVARVRALCDEWEQRGMEPGAVYQGGNAVFWTCGSAIRAVVGTQTGGEA